jgi:hypothetical protein
MFGSDNNQQQGVPTGAPVQNEDTSQQNNYGQPAVEQHQAHNDFGGGDPTAAFPPVASPDPFGTGQPQASDNVVPAVPTGTNEPSETPAPADDSLLDIKQQALQHLSPLLDHIDQPAEEKFKTTMMMIQASDDKTLVPVAYEAAKQISDDKARAQALLDIINEINYFTQQS